MINKLQRLPSKVPEKFSARFSDYLIVLVLHGTNFNDSWLFKNHVTFALINWTVFQTKFTLKLITVLQILQE